MYIRFVGARSHPHAAAELGIYFVQSRIDWSQHPCWMREEFDEAFRWFRCLAVPGVFKGKRHRHAARSLCWLKPEADWVLDELRYAAWILNEAGIPVREIRTRRPGMVIWQDEDQIVALPGEAGVPRAF